MKTGANWQIARTSKAHDYRPLSTSKQERSTSLPRQGMFPSGSLRLRFAVLESLRLTTFAFFEWWASRGSFWLTILQRLQGEMIFQTDGRPGLEPTSALKGPPEVPWVASSETGMLVQVGVPGSLAGDQDAKRLMRGEALGISHGLTQLELRERRVGPLLPYPPPA